MMRFAKREELPKIIELWREAFGDTREEIEAFFECCGDLLRVCILEEESEIRAQLVLLPVTLVCGKEYAAEYIYAVAVRRDHRGKGLATKLLREVQALLKDENKAGILVPAKDSLVGFYEKRGFCTCVSDEKYMMTLPSRTDTTTDMTYVSYGCESLKIKEISVTEYAQLRKNAFCGEGFVELPLHMLSFALNSVIDKGGECVQITYKGKNYGVLYQYAGTEINVFEVTATSAEEAIAVAKILPVVLEMKEAKKLMLRRAYHTMGICLPKESEKISIFNLVLD